MMVDGMRLSLTKRKMKKLEWVKVRIEGNTWQFGFRRMGGCVIVIENAMHICDGKTVMARRTDGFYECSSCKVQVGIVEAEKKCLGLWD